jgi:predicted SnoaL-like aldol condensation-catalyzing enzyme
MLKIIPLALVVVPGLACGGSPPAARNPEADIVQPKALVIAALDAVFGRHDATAVDKYFADPYPQHNPGFPSGVGPLRGIAGNHDIAIERVRTIAEGDLVVTHSLARGFAPEPIVAFDIFRLEDQKIVEHWDVLQPEVKRTVSGRSQIDGPTDIVDLDKTAENKQLIQGFLDDVVFGHQMDKLATYISRDTYHQHNPGVGDGLDGFVAAMTELAKAGLSMEYKKTYRIVAEGNFVFVHSEGIFAGKHVAFADLMRIEGGKIVEHWDVIQEVPDKTVSGLPMF